MQNFLCMTSCLVGRTLRHSLFFLKFLPLLLIAVPLGSMAAPKGSYMDEVLFTEISGRITDDEGNPLSGVSVTVVGTSRGTTTDADGRFAIQAQPGEVLEFSIVGFSKTTIKVTASDKQISLSLNKQNTSLEDVVVVAYGTQKKVNLTGAVSTINSKALEARPVQNMGQALQGMIPGLNLQVGGLGGELNNTMAINIRGGGTIGNTSSAPLILIDGMEGNLNAINMQDVESISVLKDASASAVYGSRAAFGVILITTKKGKVGKPTFNYNNNFRWTKPLNLPEMLDSHKFALYWNEAAANDGEGPKFGQEVLERIVQYQNGEIDYATVPNANGDRWQMYTGSNANTDWFKEQYKASAFSQQHAVNLNGGSEMITYLFSGSYLDQEGLSRHANDGFQRYTLTGKLNMKLNEYIKLNYTSRYIREDYEKATHMFDLFYHNIARRWPTVPAKDPNGNWSDASEIAQLREGGRTKDQTDWLYQQAQLIITPLKGWNIVADGNFRITNNNWHQAYQPAYSYDVNGNPFPLSVGWNSANYTSVGEYNSKGNYFNTNIYSDYEFKLKQDHSFKVMAGFNSELNKYQTISASRNGLINPDIPVLNLAVGENRGIGGEYQHWATSGFFGRINYNYKSRYLLEINSRYDGTSRYMRDKRWNFFPSASIGWNVAEEKFWFVDKVDMFKLRASFGELGNQNTNNWYPFYLTMPVGVNNGGWLINGERPNTASAPGLISTFLTWERVQTWNYGFDLGMLNNRLQLNFDYFKRKTFDMVGPAPELPVTLGTGVPQINNTDMESYGFEIEASWKDHIGKINYSVRAVLADDQQKITRYPNTSGSLANWYEGRMVGEIWGYTTIGIAQTKEEMDAHLAKTTQPFGGNWGAGDIMYADMNGDGKVDGGANTLSNPGDRKIIGSSAPRFRYSFDLGADYNGFDVRVFLQGVGKRDWMPNGPYFWGASGGMWQSAGFETHMDYFRDENSTMVKAGVAGVNTNSYFPKPYFNTGKNQQTQTRYLQNAAYMRVKNIQVGYTLPRNMLRRIGVNNLRIFLSGENLFTITKMIDTFDPETVALSGWNDGKTYPLAKVLSCGLNVNF